MSDYDYTSADGLLERVRRSMLPDAVMVTYSCGGQKKGTWSASSFDDFIGAAGKHGFVNLVAARASFKSTGMVALNRPTPSFVVRSTPSGLEQELTGGTSVETYELRARGLGDADACPARHSGPPRGRGGPHRVQDVARTGPAAEEDPTE
jgi:hypothetical protein